MITHNSSFYPHLILFLISAKLKSNKEVCVNPEIRWLQQYLKNALNK